MSKAYTVTAKRADVSVLVWADAAIRAKSLGHKTEWLCEEDWTELTARREPTLDGKRAEGYCAEGDKPEDQRLMRDLGWFELEGSGVPCKECDRYAWGNVPESRLDENDVCAECKKTAWRQYMDEGHEREGGK